MARTRCPKTGRFNRFNLGDDGTMDTVVVCSQCGTEMRFNYDPAGPDSGVTDEEAADPENAEDLYDEWVAECCDEAAEEHEQDTEDC